MRDFIKEYRNSNLLFVNTKVHVRYLRNIFSWLIVTPNMTFLDSLMCEECLVMGSTHGNVMRIRITFSLSVMQFQTFLELSYNL